ncbi:hypothetical protein IF1G_04343 [Cordyceps javanica]|uniref:Uncharacterized protein n=1 Tax=Cordyceps javanica TaxID=43265 RepID=A0A545V5W2_9HYPO|nr:hypothetical protein IF1G_04343 [Cordyceps javanica]
MPQPNQMGQPFQRRRLLGSNGQTPLTLINTVTSAACSHRGPLRDNIVAPLTWQVCKFHTIVARWVALEIILVVPYNQGSFSPCAILDLSGGWTVAWPRQIQQVQNATRKVTAIFERRVLPSIFSIMLTSASNPANQRLNCFSRLSQVTMLSHRRDCSAQQQPCNTPFPVHRAGFVLSHTVSSRAHAGTRPTFFAQCRAGKLGGASHSWRWSDVTVIPPTSSRLHHHLKFYPQLVDQTCKN